MTVDKYSFDAFRNGKKILSLVKREQVIQKNAFFIQMEHKRLNMKKRLPMPKSITEILVTE